MQYSTWREALHTDKVEINFSLLFRMVSMWESLEPQGCDSHSPPLHPPEMPTSDSKVKKKKKKKKCVCVCMYIYIYEQLRHQLSVFILTLTVLLALCLGYTKYLKLWENCSLLSGMWLPGKKFSLCGWEITGGSWNTFFEKMISDSPI